MYQIERKELETTLSLVADVLNLGERSDTSAATFEFKKDGVIVHAQNSIASYMRELTCDVKEAKPTKVALTPDLLKGFCRGKESLILIPNSNGCKVQAKPSFKADLYAVGEPSLVEAPDAGKKAVKLSSVSESALKAASVVANFKNRTDKEALNGFLTWDKGTVNLVVADTHHAVSVTIEGDGKGGSGEVKLPLNLLQLVLKVRGDFMQTENTIIAQSEFEFVSVQSLPVKEDRADVESLMEEKATTRFTTERDTFNAVAEALFGNLAETDAVNISFGEKGALIQAESSASKAQDLLKGEVKGKARAVSVSLNHLRDCMGAQVGKKIIFEIRGNILFITSSSGDMKVQSFAVLRG